MNFRFLNSIVLLLLSGAVLLMTSCDKDEPFVLTQEDIIVKVPEGGFTAKVNQLLRITPEYPANEAIDFLWLLNEEVIATTPNLEYMFEIGGDYKLNLTVTHDQQSFSYEYAVKVIFEEVEDAPEGATAYITDRKSTRLNSSH